MKVIELHESVTASNDADAQALRIRMKEQGSLLINLMSSPGSGKTTLLGASIKALKDEMKIGVMEADIDSSVDAERMEAAGAESIQVHTDGMCHMDAGMSAQGLASMKRKMI
jgi:hydrogenase nickel incorporation protein HypB